MTDQIHSRSSSLQPVLESNSQEVRYLEEARQAVNACALILSPGDQPYTLLAILVTTQDIYQAPAKTLGKCGTNAAQLVLLQASLTLVPLPISTGN